MNGLGYALRACPPMQETPLLWFHHFYRRYRRASYIERTNPLPTNKHCTRIRQRKVGHVSAASLPPGGFCCYTHPNITVIGTGYLAATHAACMARLGYDVVALDVEMRPRSIRKLSRGHSPI